MLKKERKSFFKVNLSCGDLTFKIFVKTLDPDPKHCCKR